MAEISPNARKIYEAMQLLGANAEDKTKSADQIMEKAKMGKGLVNQCLQELQDKKVVERIAKSKRAGYFICQEV